MESNRILKKMMEKVWRTNRRKLAIKLSVDIQNCEPILNPTMKKDMKDNLFIYLNDNYEILGFLKGYEILRQLNNDFAIYVDYIRNRKNLLANAKYVLMFTPEMRKFNIKPERYKSSWRENTQHTINLKNRLEEYKAKKYSNLTHEQIKDIIQNIVTKLNEDLFANNLAEKFTSEIGYNRTSIEILSRFMSITTNYIQSYNSFVREQNFYNTKKENYNLKELWSYNNYLKSKNEIILWNKLINKTE